MRFSERKLDYGWASCVHATTAAAARTAAAMIPVESFGLGAAAGTVASPGNCSFSLHVGTLVSSAMRDTVAMSHFAIYRQHHNHTTDQTPVLGNW